MSKIIFVVPALSDSHYKNRILEFCEHNYEVEVYGFTREGHKNPDNLPYSCHSLGELADSNYKDRVKKYYVAFRSLGKQYASAHCCFYLCGLDIAMFFHYLNPSIKYIYEECDLTHTYMGKIKYLLEIVDKRIIKSSILTITTSQGFINYHFNGVKPDNVCLVENKLNPNIVNCNNVKTRVFTKDQLSIGFVGSPRFDSVLNFIDVFCRNFPDYSFHIYGGPIRESFEILKKYNNCYFHGFFNNPDDLPKIYSNIDLVLATYDTKFENVRYAEPNKIYESIYFETPIIVSRGTFLAEKVNKMRIGYSVNAMDSDEIVSFINKLTEDGILELKKRMKTYDKREMLSINQQLFAKLKKVL